MKNTRILLISGRRRWLNRLAEACRREGFDVETARSINEARGQEFQKKLAENGAAKPDFDLKVVGKKSGGTADEFAAFAFQFTKIPSLITDQTSLPVLLEEIRAALFEEKTDSPTVVFEKGNPSKVIVKTDGGCQLEVRLLNLNWFFQTANSPIFSQKIEPGETHISLKRQLPRWLLRAFVIVKTDGQTRLVIPF